MDQVTDRLEQERVELLAIVNQNVPAELLQVIENSTQFLHLTEPSNQEVIISVETM